METDTAPDAEDFVASAQRDKHLRQALSSLSREHMVVLQLSYFSDRSHTEFGRDLGVPLRTVKGRLRQALTRLRASLYGDEVMSGGAATTIRRHPSEATLVAYAGGTVWDAARPLIQRHLELCAQCRTGLELAEAVGGALLDELPPTPLALGALDRVSERLRGNTAYSARSVLRSSPAAEAEPTVAPCGLRDVRLRWLAPGVRHAVLLRGPRSGTLRLLRVRPGTALPRHTHCGTELTLVLEGAFTDETGRHGPGDLVEVEEEASHRPMAQGPADCVCLIAAEGRLRFGGLLGALFGAVARV